MSLPVIVLDSGGCTCKLGVAGQPDSVTTFPNCTAKQKGERGTFVGEDVLQARDVSSLSIRRPVDRGYVTAWEAQKEIWARALRKLLNNQPPTALGLVLTESYMNLPGLREAALQVIFDEIGFASVFITTPAPLALRHHYTTHPDIPANAAGCGLVIDCGFSYTHAVPVFDWRVIKSSVRRIDLGGKALTNFMKELVSYRSINMMDETYLLEYIKNQLCFVSKDPVKDLTAAKARNSPYKIEYVLPDGVTSTWGHIRTPEEAANNAGSTILVVNNERFMVPEAIFHPSDIGMEEAGLAEVVAEAIASCHPHLHSLLYSNILLIGGTTKCPGFKERLEAELRPLVPDDYEMNIYQPDDPVTAAWKGGALFGASSDYRAMAMTRQEWMQHGVAACGKFLDG